jgi:hypothetical protein
MIFPQPSPCLPQPTPSFAQVRGVQVVFVIPPPSSFRPGVVIVASLPPSSPGETPVAVESSPPQPEARAPAAPTVKAMAKIMETRIFLSFEALIMRANGADENRHLRLGRVGKSAQAQRIPT